MIEFKLEKRPDERTGQMLDTLVKYIQPENGQFGQEPAAEIWCTVPDIDRLFEACVSRWGDNWDLNKLVTCVAECEFD